MKPIYKWILVGIAIIFLAAAAGIGYGYYVLKSEVPKYGETIKLAGLAKPVDVIYDKWGVPHIFGGSDQDLVRALGYLHARDRLWQMDLVRRAAAGRLSEIIGEATYDSDVFQRVIGFQRNAEASFEKLSDDTKVLLTSYAEGVNAFIDSHPEHPTIEFRAIGYEMEHWKPSDTIMLARMTGWTLSSNMTAEIIRLALLNERGEEAMWQLMPLHKDNGPYIIPPEEKKYGHGARLEQHSPVKFAGYDPKVLVRLLNISEEARETMSFYSGSGFASNSWVVAPKKSSTGGAILCNDPHLELMLPSVWHEAHMVGENINVAGVVFPGTPIVVIGQNQKIAWGVTSTAADLQDLYILKVNEQNPNEYMYSGEWETFQTVEEKIKIRKKAGFEEKTIKVRISRQGPVITDSVSDLPKGLPPLALRWVGFEVTDEMQGILGAGKAASREEFLAAMRNFGVPIQNFIYADTLGNIGYIANGLLPIRAKSDGSMPVPGDDPAYEWKGFVPYDQLPQFENPSSGFIATANNKVVPDEDYPYIVSTRFAPPFRAMRIVEVLKSKEKFSVKDMSDLQMDNKLMSGEMYAKYFIDAYDKKGDKADERLKNLVDMLRKWDFFTPTNSVATLFFLESYRQAFRLTYEDEMSEDLFKMFREERTGWTGFENGIEADFSLFDDRRTKDVTETRDDILANAMSEAVAQLSKDMGDDISKWEWGKRHLILFNHPFGSISEAMRKAFSLGPFELAGSRDTVNNGYFSWFVAPYIVWEGPSLRRIIEFGNPDDSRITITVGQSLHRLSPHYGDQVNDWLSGNGHPMPMTREGVEKIKEGSITLTP